MKLLVLVLMGACSQSSDVMPDALPAGCGSNKTETGGPLYRCDYNGADGVCTDDVHGRVRCFVECTEQSACPDGTPMVLVVDDGTRVCYCNPDEQAPPGQ